MYYQRSVYLINRISTRSEVFEEHRKTLPPSTRQTGDVSRSGRVLALSVDTRPQSRHPSRLLGNAIANELRIAVKKQGSQAYA